MDKTINYNELFGEDDIFKVPEKIKNILLNKKERENLFMRLLQAHNYNVDYDWFYEYFQDEYAERNKKKQDFTPRSVCNVLSKLTMTDKYRDYYECCAGTGGILIVDWNNFRRTFSPFDYKPQYHFAFVEELSDRCIPFLLLNMMIRGMNGVVLHCDTITRKCKNAYFICNTKNDHLQFSDISVIPHTEQFEKEFKIKWTSPDYIEHLELMDLDEVYALLG